MRDLAPATRRGRRLTGITPNDDLQRALAVALDGRDFDVAGLDPEQATALLELAIEGLEQRLSSPGEDAAGLAAALRAIVAAVRQLNARLLAERRRALADAHAALSRLRGISDVSSVIAQGVATLAPTADLDRVVFFRVEDGCVVVHAAVTPSDPRQAELLVSGAHHVRSAARVAEILRRRKPRLFSGTPADEPSLSMLGDASSYVLAPVLPAGSPIGLIYADRASTGRQVDALDRDTLWTFAEGFGYAIERSALIERLRAQRQHFRRMAITGEAVMAELADAPIRVPAPHDDGAFWDTLPSDLRIAPEEGRAELLSAREREVMDLLAQGARNREIAARLVVSEETVKWHVSKILRKLRAMNRAEAVSRYLRLSSQLRN